MDLKQAYIKLGWEIDDSNLKKAQSLTDGLVDTIKKNGVSASNDFANSFRAISDKVDSTQAKIKGLIDTQKSINDIQINHPINDMDSFNSSINKSIDSANRLKDKLSNLNGGHAQFATKDVSSGVSEGFQSNNPSKLHLFSNIVSGVTIGNLLSNTFSNLTSNIKEALSAGMQYDQNKQKMNATWNTLTGNSAKAKDMVNTVDTLSVKTGQASDTVDELEQGFYHLDSSKSEADDMTKAMLNMSDAVGLTTPKIDAVKQDMINGLSRGKANAGLLNQISQYFPMFRENLAKYETQIHHGQKVTVADLTSMAKYGKISAKDIENVFEKLGNGKYDKAADNMLQTMVGMQRTIHARVPSLIGAFEEPILKAKNPFYGTISKWVSDKHTQDEFTKMGDATSKGINTITDAFAKAYGVKNGTKVLDETLTKITSGITKLSNGIARSAPEIKDFFSMTKSTGVESLKLFAGVMSDVAKVTLPFLDFAVKHEHVVAPLLAGMFVANKALKFAGALKAVAGSITMVKNAGQGLAGENGGRSSLLSNIIGYGTTPGGFRTTKPNTSINRASEAFNIKGDESSLADNISGVKLGDLKSLKDGAFRSKSFIADGEFATEASKLGKFGKLAGAGSLLFGGTKLGSFIDHGGTSIAKGLTKITGFAKSSPILSKIGGVASKIPFLDVAAAGMNLVGMNRHNAGNKIGSSAGMLGGSILGGVLGGPIGAMVGGWLGQSIGGPVGDFMQKKLPGIFSKGWNDVKNGIGKAISFIGNSFKDIGSVSVSAWNATKSKISSAWNGLGTIASKAWSGTKNVFQNAMKGLSDVTSNGMKVVSNAFQHSGPVIKGIAKGISVGTNDYFQGMFKTATGIFKIGSDLISGRWSNLDSDLKQIGSGILETLESPFKGAWTAIQSIVSNISGAVKDVMSSISSMGKKATDIARHPIKSIESLFASGSNRYQNGLPKTTRAVVNDGNGPELINFGNGFGMYKGRNVHTVLPKGAHVYTAADTRKMVGEQAFANGTTTLNTNLKIGKNNLAESIQNSGRLANTNFVKMSRSLNTKNMQLHDQMFKTNVDSAKKINANNQSLSDKTVGNFTDMGKQLDPIWNKTVNAFGNYFNQLGPNAKNGMQGAVDALNQGISGIDKTLQQFGGNDSVLSPIHYAHGTDGVANKDHMAIVNDAKSGPQMEAIVNQAGQARYVSGTNAKTVIRKGESVLTGTDTLTAINEGLIPHYAKGKSSKSALRSLAKTNAKNAKNAFNAEFTNNVQLTGSGLQKGLTKMGTNASASDNNGYKWSNAMWKVINNTIQGSGPAGGLLGAVEKYGKGKKYVWGATGPDAFDCSGLVQYALKTAFGISYPRTSGMQIAKAAGIPRSEAQPGDLIGNSEHIGVVADKGASHYFSAFNPSSHPNILMTPVNGSYFPGTPKFGRVSGIKNKNAGSSSGIKGVSNFMKQLVTSELGSNALNSITKSLSDSDGGASGNPAGDGVNRWKPDVIKALGALHLSTSGNMIDRVLRQINTESSGNPNAIGGTDGLNDGRAMGLMQVKPGTFSEYGRPDLGRWNNGYASIYAGLNYAKHRYGDSLSYLGQGHGYASGGRPHIGETAWVGERGPELVHFDSPASIESNARSVSTLRRQQSSGGNNVTISKGAINITVKAAKNAVETAKLVDNVLEQRLHRLFHEGKKDVQGGTI